MLSRTMCCLVAGGLLTQISSVHGQGSLEQRLERLDRVLEQERQSGHIAGMALAVVKDDRIVHAHGYGVADVEHDEPVTPRTSFCIGSTTKAFTSMLLAMLETDGVLHLDDAPSEYLPIFHLADPEADARVTLIDLMSHRTGLTRQSLLWYGNGAPRELILEHVVQAQAWAPFRTAFLYNNVMYLAAGEVAARAAESTWEDLLQTRILGPLGMTETTPTHAGYARSTMSKGYDWDAKTQGHSLLPWRDIDDVGPAGSIVSDVMDMAQWLRFLLARGVWSGQRLVSESSFERLFQPENDAGGNVSYGLGWFLRQRDGHPLYEHGGNIDGFSAQVGLLPDEGLGFVLLTNRNNAGLQQASVSLVFDALTKPWEELAVETSTDSADLVEGPAKTEAEMTPLVGKYSGKGIPLSFQVEIVAERLTVTPTDQPALSLRWPDRKGRWRVDAAPEIWLTFPEPKGNWVESMTFHQGVDLRLLRQDEVDPDLPMTAGQLFALRQEKLGAEAVDALSSVVLRGSLVLVHAGMRGEVIWAGDREGRACLVANFGPLGSARQVAGLDQGWIQGAVIGDHRIVGEALEDLRLLNPLALAGDWRDYAEDVRVDCHDEAGRLPAVRVTLFGYGGARFTRLVDLDDGRLLLERGSNLFGLVSGGDLHFEDYREVGGVRLPFRIWMENSGTGRVEYRFETAEIDVDLDPRWFEMEIR